jgi:hypothetical protein
VQGSDFPLRVSLMIGMLWCSIWDLLSLWEVYDVSGRNAGDDLVERWGPDWKEL